MKKLTKREAQRLIEKHGTQTKAALALGVSPSTICRALAGGRDAELRSTKTTSDSEAPVTGEKTNMPGISLRSVRTAKNKPQRSCRSNFYGLEAGKAYLLEDAVKEWGIGAETIKRYAKDMNAFVYVEVGPEDWRPAIVRPKG